MDISPDHPRYRSLIIRERLADAVQKGVVTPTGMISHGRGEAFDYLLGEQTTPEAELAERVAAASLLLARNPVICVNGNAAALAGKELIELAATVPALLEVNLFHRTDERMDTVISYLISLGAKNILGKYPDAEIEGIASERARCTKEGIFSSDVILVPIEDGDRAEALVKMGKKVIAIDLNPLSRTSRAATVSIVDEAVRAVENITNHVRKMKGDTDELEGVIKVYSNEENLKDIVTRISDSLKEKFIEEKEVPQ